VPVLQLPGGQVIEQSLDIMRWALAQHDPQQWLAHEGTPASTSLIEHNDGPFKQLLDRYKYPERHLERTQAAYRDEALGAFLMPLEHRLQTHANLLGEQPGLTDMALLPFIRQFAQVDAHWFEHAPLPALQAWLNRHLASPLFESVMLKYPLWQAGAPPSML
jgi:glutathione S-transferase